MRFFLPVTSAAPDAVAGCLSACGEAELVREGEAGDLGTDTDTDTGEAQRMRLMLLPLLSPSLPSASLAASEPSPVRAIPTSRVLYGLRRVLDLLALGEAARAMALRCLVIPMRFIMSFSMAGMRIERSLWRFLPAIVLCVARGRAAKVSRATCSARRETYFWTRASWYCGHRHPSGLPSEGSIPLNKGFAGNFTR